MKIRTEILATKLLILRLSREAKRVRTLLQDTIFTLRQLRKNPAFALTSMISIALGIGATSAVFSVVYAVLMNPYPYRDASQLAYLNLRDKAGNDRGVGLSAFQIR